MINKPIPAWAKEHVDKIADHDRRLIPLESVYQDVADIRKYTSKIWGAIKWGAPTIIASAVTAGYINGDFAKLLLALFG